MKYCDALSQPALSKFTWAVKPAIIKAFVMELRKYCREVFQTVKKFKANHAQIYTARAAPTLYNIISALLPARPRRATRSTALA